MEAAKKRKVFGIAMRIVFFLVLFSAFFGLYHSPFSYFNDSYGLLKGPKEQIIVRNLMGVWDFVYIKSINCLYLFLGEKPGVMIGYHIFLRMINCLLLFFSIEKVGKPVLSGVFTLVYGMYPFVIYELYNYDGVLIAEFFCLLLLFLVSSIIKAVINAIVAKRRQKNTASYGGITPQWEAENQIFGQDLLKRKEMTEEELPEANKGEEGFYPESGKSLQVEKIGEQMKQNETISGSMEKEEVIKERDGIPNFLELTDEEIRRNAMIAAGLLSGEEEKPLFRKSMDDKQQPAAAEPMKETEASKGTEGAKQQDVKMEQPKKQTNMKLEQSDMEKERSNMTRTQFIENPLPVPKRHVKKEMDYEYQVPEEQMHYDIEEPDKNYFDVV